MSHFSGSITIKTEQGSLSTPHIKNKSPSSSQTRSRVQALDDEHYQLPSTSKLSVSQSKDSSSEALSSRSRFIRQ